MNFDEQAAWLNSVVKLRLAPSPIHGVGIFAMRDIQKDTKLYADAFPQLYNLPYSSFNKLFPEVRDLILERWPRVIEGSGFAYPETFLQAYMNHSDDPNYDGQKDITLKDIKAGEEITENYRIGTNWPKAYPWLVVKKERKISIPLTKK